MKAVCYRKYGGPEVVHLEELPVGTVGDNDIKVKVHFASVNRTDCATIKASPFVARFFTGLLKPRTIITGSDFAGEVIEVGAQVRKYKVGDHVFGFFDYGLSSHAEFLVLSASKPIAKLNPSVKLDEAAACIEGAHYACNFLNKVKLKASDRVLVNGATGAIGSALLRLLILDQVHVDAVGDTANQELLKELGATKVYNFETEDFSASGREYDYIFDAVGKSSFKKCQKVLSEKGIYISSELGQNSENIFYALFTPLWGGRKVIFPIPVDKQGSVNKMAQLLDGDNYPPVIDRYFLPNEVQKAFKYVDSGQKTGAVLLQFI